LRNFAREEEINRERIRRLANWYLGKKEGPIHIDAELHKRCNLNCSFCPRSGSGHDSNAESKTNELFTEQWIKTVRDASEMGVAVFNLEGANEPIYVPELAFPVIEEIKKAGMYGILTTNGTLWTEEKLKNLVDIKWDRIHFSVDAPDAEIHDSLRGIKGSFEMAMQSIKLLNKWKERIGSNLPMLNMNIMICNKNYYKLPEMVELANKLKVDYIFVEPLMIFSESGKKLKIKDEDVKNRLPNYIKDAKALADKYEIDNNFSKQDKNLDEDLVVEENKKKVLIKDLEVLADKDIKKGTLLSAPCFKPWTRIAIKYDGLTGHCGLIQDGESLKEKSLREIWYGEWLDNIRNKMMKGQLLEHCSQCVPSDITQRRRFRRELLAILDDTHGLYN